MRRKCGRELRLNSEGKMCVFFFFFSTGEGQIRGEHVRCIILFAGALRGGRNHWQLTDTYCNLNSPVLVLLGLLGGLSGPCQACAGPALVLPANPLPVTSAHAARAWMAWVAWSTQQAHRFAAHQGQKSSDSTTLLPPRLPVYMYLHPLWLFARFCRPRDTRYERREPTICH